MNKIAMALCTTVLVSAAGCASPPSVPTDFNPQRAAIMAAATSPTVVLDGPGSKGSAAAKGGATWGGVGFVVGGVLCMGTGPMAPLCLGTMVPAGLAVGAVGGAVVGAVKAEGDDESMAKRALLEAELAAWSARLPLASQLQARAGAPAAGVAGNLPGTANPASWELKFGLTELATVGSGSGAPYALKASARLDMLRVGQAQAPFVKVYAATTATRMTTVEWSASDSQPLRAALDLMAQDLVTQVAKDLAAVKTVP